MQRAQIKTRIPPRKSSKAAEQRQKPHICTIKQLASETGISEYTVRCWVKQGKFKTLRSGSKCLINYDVFMKFLNGENEETQPAAPAKGIRKVEL